MPSWPARTWRQARAAIVAQLRAPDGAAGGDRPPLRGEPRPIEHTVRYYEQGDRPLEFITTRQWFVRLTDKRRELIERGREIQWHPGYMLSRYVNWTENLQFDWCISRQRFFGVPFPVWYALDEHGAPNYEQPAAGATGGAAGGSAERHAARLRSPSSATGPTDSPPRRTCSTPGSPAP